MYLIIRCLEFCRRQELPPGDHRDSGSFDLVEPDHSEGVFKAALRLLLEYNKNSNLFMHAPCNASFCVGKSKMMGNKIQNLIVTDVNENEYLSILADETSDMNQA